MAAELHPDCCLQSELPGLHVFFASHRALHCFAAAAGLGPAYVDAAHEAGWRPRDDYGYDIIVKPAQFTLDLLEPRRFVAMRLAAWPDISVAFMDIDTAATFYGVSRSTLARWRVSGSAPPASALAGTFAERVPQPASRSSASIPYQLAKQISKTPVQIVVARTGDGSMMLGWT